MTSTAPLAHFFISLTTPEAIALAIGFAVFVLTTGFVAVGCIAYWWTTQRPGRGYPAHRPSPHLRVIGGNGVSAEDRWERAA